ncbi:dephospho-CoA kinase [Parasphingorhabdus pacifica]
MLRVGLSGGIGSGKSTVARRLAEWGAIVIDADVIAREVVRPGSAGLTELVERFGPDILDADGALDRPAMAARVFGDEESRAALNSITHPRIGARTAELMAEAPEDGIVVHDMPLLVEAGYAADYHLVVIVDAPEEDRVRRLIDRGLDESDARARIRAQATGEQRRAAADVWIDNSGPVEGVLGEVDELWQQRLVPFERNLRARRPPEREPGRLMDSDPEWPRTARRWIARIGRAAGERALRMDHIGSTAVPGLPAEDLLDVQLTVASWVDAEAIAEPLAQAGLPRRPDVAYDPVRDIEPDPAQWRKSFHVSADPGRPLNLHVRVEGTAGWRYGLLLPAWLRATPEAREKYERVKRETVARAAAEPSGGDRAEAEDPWFAEALPLADEWAAETGWYP